MRIGLQLTDHDWPGGPGRYPATLAGIAAAAEQAGFDSIAVPDHLWQSTWFGGPERDLPEAYSVLCYLAAITERVDLLATVSGVHYRHPAMLAKLVATLDVLSGGRAWLGIGAGSSTGDAAGLGLPFPPLKDRFDMLEEAIEICLRIWRSDDEPFHGAHYDVPRPLARPRPVARPRPPILIGGDGETRTLDLVARYADACFLRPSTQLGRKLDVLRAHCERVGRDFAEIRRCCAFAIDVGPDGAAADQVVGQLRALAAQGIQAVIARVEQAHLITPLEIIGRRVIPELAEHGDVTGARFSAPAH